MSYPNITKQIYTNVINIDDVRTTCREEQSIFKNDILSAVENVGINKDLIDNKPEPLTQNITRAMGDYWFSIDGTIPPGGLPHLGHLVSRSTYGDFYLWLEGTKTILSDTEWLAYANSHGGCCPYYSSGDGSTTFRTPSYDQSFLKVLSTISETGKWEKAGLPAHYHKIFTYQESGTGESGFGNFITSNSGTVSNYMNVRNYAGEIFNSSIYGNSDTVTPQNFGILVGVYAVGAIVPVGTTDAEKIMSGVTRVEGLLGNKIDKVSVSSYVIETYSSGTEWYRKYSDGWIEQSNTLNLDGSSKTYTVSYRFPFKNTNYYISTEGIYSSNGGTDHQESMNEFVSKSSTGFKKYIWGNMTHLRWVASGYI